jgi:hypothetical protein
MIKIKITALPKTQDNNIQMLGRQRDLNGNEVSTFENSNNTIRGITFPTLKLSYTTVVTKTVQLWHYRNTGQWNRIRRPEIYLKIHGQLIFGNGTKRTQRTKNILINKWCWENWIFTCKQMKLENWKSSYNIHKNQLKMDERPRNHKISRREHKENPP